jgi:hypothetical protein
MRAGRKEESLKCTSLARTNPTVIARLSHRVQHMRPLEAHFPILLVLSEELERRLGEFVRSEEPCREVRSAERPCFPPASCRRRTSFDKARLFLAFSVGANGPGMRREKRQVELSEASWPR